MIKDREIVDVNLSICELLAVSYTRQYRTRLAQSSGCSRIYIYIYIYILYTCNLMLFFPVCFSCNTIRSGCFHQCRGVDLSEDFISSEAECGSAGS